MRLRTASTVCRACRWIRAAQAGQSTVEFAVILAAFICVVAGAGAIWHITQDGDLVRHAVASASHHVGSGDAGAWGDVLVY